MRRDTTSLWPRRFRTVCVLLVSEGVGECTRVSIASVAARFVAAGSVWCGLGSTRFRVAVADRCVAMTTLPPPVIQLPPPPTPVSAPLIVVCYHHRPPPLVTYAFLRRRGPPDRHRHIRDHPAWSVRGRQPRPTASARRRAEGCLECLQFHRRCTHHTFWCVCV